MKPKIVVDPLVYRKVMHWVNKSSDEISGLGMVEFNEKTNTFHITDTMLLEQRNGAAETELQPDDINRAQFELINAKGDLRWHWHSHVNMAVFWSSTDHAMMKLLSDHGWFITTVFNKKAEQKSAYSSTNHLFPIFLDDLTFEVAKEEIDTKAWDEEYEKKCKKIVPPLASTTVPLWDRGTSRWVHPTANHGNMGGQRYITEAEKQDALIKNQRPRGMSKREWKEYKREQELIRISQSKVDDETMLEMQREDDLLSQFTQQQLHNLRSLGIDDVEVIYMLDHGYTKEDVLAQMEGQLIDDDVPVADRRYHGI